MNKMIGIFAILVFSVPSFAAEYLVKYRNPHSIQSFSSNQWFEIRDVHPQGKLIKIDITDKNKVNGMVRLLSDPNVEYIVPNARMHAFTIPIEPRALKQQWAIAKVQAEKAWQRAGNKGSRKVTVAVIDTGIDGKHQSLSPNMVAGYDFAGNDNDPMDETSAQNPGHGTHCAGVIGATGIVDDGTVGLSPEVSLMAIRFLDKNGGGDLNNAVKSIDYAIEKGVDVISASWGGAIPRPQAMPILEAIARAEKKGIVFVVAAGNDGRNNDSYEVYPANANLSNTISVAASDANDQKPSWSDYGRKMVHVASPGAEIMSTLPNNQYGNLSGTSMATPLVAGLVALIKAQDNSLTPSQIKSLLQSTGSKVAIQTACDCRVDALSAIETVKSKKMFVSPFAATLAIGEKLQAEAVYAKGSVEFSSSDPSVASVSANGLIEALKEGEIQITAKDSNGAIATSHKIVVGQTPPAPGDGGGGGGMPEIPGGGSCPTEDEALCQIACQIMPDLPWCTAQ